MYIYIYINISTSVVFLHLVNILKMLCLMHQLFILCLIVVV